MLTPAVAFVLACCDDAAGLPASVTLGGPDKAGLANVTATMINLMGFEAPADYEPSLLAVA